MPDNFANTKTGLLYVVACFKSALAAAGMDEILKEYQSQLDAWLAEQE